MDDLHTIYRGRVVAKETIHHITFLGNGWYNFEKLDQTKRYIKIANLRCGTDRKAINRARKIIGDPKAAIIINS